MFDKILLPTDGSEFSEHEVERAIKALSDDGEIIILSVASKLEATTPFQRKKNIESLNEEFLKEAYDNVDRMAKRFDEHVADKRYSYADEDVDLIIISASGKSGLHKFFIGSVAEKVLRKTEKDVLLVHN